MVRQPMGWLLDKKGGDGSLPRPVPLRCIPRTGLEGDCACGASINANTTLDASCLVDHGLPVLDLDSALRALVHACAASDAVVADLYGHCVLPPFGIELT